MTFLARLEEACAVFVERIFANTFPSGMQPAEVARKMAAALEAYALGEEGRRLPQGFTVRVAPGDYERLAPREAELVARWRLAIEEMAESLGVRFAERPEIRLLADPSIPAGGAAVEVEATPVAGPALVVRRGIPTGARLSLERGGTIGRAAACELVLRDPRVSRRHARVERGAQGAEIVDLGSRNGTYVDGQRVERASLRAGTRVELGDTLLEVEEAPSDP